MIKCPDCGRNNKTEVTNGKVKCKRCHQHIIIENGKPICCVPSGILD